MTSPSTATLSFSPTSFPSMVGVLGSRGTSVSGTLSGSGLGANNATVPAPTGFVVSLDNSSFSSSQTVVPSSGSINQTIWYAIASTASVGPVSGTSTITCVGAGVASVPVSLAGTVSSAKDFMFVYFGFTSTSLAGWQQLVGDPSTGIRTVTNASGLITCSSVATANWLQFFGVCAAAHNGNAAATNVAPATVMDEFWFSNNFPTTFADAFNSGKPKIQFTGLKTGATYTVEMSASSTANLNQSTDYRVIGSSTYGPTTIQIKNNNSGVIGTGIYKFTTVVPNGSGIINIYSNSTDLNQDISGLSYVKVTEN